MALMAERSVRPAVEREGPSLGALLTAAERALAADLEAGLRAAGYQDVRSAHAQVFVGLDVEGSRLTALAARAGMTKQAMGELVRYLEQHGYLSIEPDTRDRRAKMIRPTALGRTVLEACVELAAESDRRLADRLGEKALYELRMRLGQIASRTSGPRGLSSVGR